MKNDDARTTRRRSWRGWPYVCSGGCTLEPATTTVVLAYRVRLECIVEIHTSLGSLRLHHRTHHHNPDEGASGVPDCFHLAQEKVIFGDGTPNILGSSDVLAVPRPFLNFCYAIAVSRSCHRLASVDIDLDFGRVRVCHHESLDFDEAACPVIVDCRMVPGPAAKGGR